MQRGLIVPFYDDAEQKFGRTQALSLAGAVLFFLTTFLGIDNAFDSLHGGCG